jgi:hypothetical protein
MSRRAPGGEADSSVRPAGRLAGAVCAWRKLPFVVVVIVAAVTTAFLRLVGVS